MTHVAFRMAIRVPGLQLSMKMAKNPQEKTSLVAVPRLLGKDRPGLTDPVVCHSLTQRTTSHSLCKLGANLFLFAILAIAYAHLTSAQKETNLTSCFNRL